MKSFGLFRGVFLLTLCIALVFAQDENPPKKKRRGCKCLKKYMTEVNAIVDQKLKRFEEKYFVSALPGMPTGSERLTSAADRRFIKLSADVKESKDVLSRLNTTIRTIKDQFLTQKHDVSALTSLLHKMDGVVNNLTEAVHRIEVMQPAQGELRMQPSPLTEISTRPPGYPRDCHEVYNWDGMKFKGDYYIMIKPDGLDKPFKAHCKVFNNSGWTVIQKRQDGSVDFFRKWKEYKEGFGNLEGEFWLGNDYIHALTTQDDTMVHMDMEDWTGKHLYAEYDHFSVEGEKENYRLHVSGYHGNAGDSLTSYWENHDGMMFSTHDKDNDGRYYDNCAKAYHGAWWFNNCFDSHLNGKYYHKGFHSNYFQRDGIQWNSIHMYSSLKNVEMMVKPSDRPKPAAKITNDVV
ncbi:fibrinogen-like protein 1 [Patella vulgata]|uniref:fibrinogen-like protein 1 n=1 Tax=Patella vulgata TaxID=6465 RepID=UPI0021804D63|nr:fibrinogen-like protein 1 [Patella vulgata]